MDLRSIPEGLKFELDFDNLAYSLYTASPGVIKAFNYTTGMATVQMSVRIKSIENGFVKYLDPPLIENVPVVLPASVGGGLFLTVPVNVDDPCLLVFGQRGIDNVVELGGIQNPTDTDLPLTTRIRHHDMTDAICIVGLGLKPYVPANWQSDAVELRNDDRTTVVSVKDGSVNVTTPQVNVTSPAINVLGDNVTTFSKMVLTNNSTTGDLNTDTVRAAKYMYIQSGSAPTPAVSGQIYFNGSHFYGRIGTDWKQLDN